MQALPLTYAGREFRSRLEADWSATLDSIGVAWDYEPQGYELSDGSWYSPDFYLPRTRTYLEVKGAHRLGISKVHRFAADLEAETWEGSPPQVVLGLDPALVPPVREAAQVRVVSGGLERPAGFFVCPAAGAELTIDRIDRPRPCACGRARVQIDPVPFVRVPRPSATRGAGS